MIRYTDILKMRKALKKAIKIAGGETALAEKLGMIKTTRHGKVIGATRQGVHQWQVAPPHWVLSIEAATGVSRYELRPDIYGKKMPS